MSKVAQLNCNMSGNEEVEVNNGSVSSAEKLLDRIHEYRNQVAFQTIRCKLYDIADRLLDSQEKVEVSVEKILELMDYTVECEQSL